MPRSEDERHSGASHPPSGTFKDRRGRAASGGAAAVGSHGAVCVAKAPWVRRPADVGADADLRADGACVLPRTRWWTSTRTERSAAEKSEPTRLIHARARSAPCNESGVPRSRRPVCNRARVGARNSLRVPTASEGRLWPAAVGDAKEGERRRAHGGCGCKRRSLEALSDAKQSHSERLLAKSTQRGTSECRVSAINSRQTCSICVESTGLRALTVSATASSPPRVASPDVTENPLESP